MPNVVSIVKASGLRGGCEKAAVQWGKGGVLGCLRKLGSMLSKWVINLLINGVYWGCNTLTNLLLTSWDIQVWYGTTGFS